MRVKGSPAVRRPSEGVNGRPAVRLVCRPEGHKGSTHPLPQARQEGREGVHRPGCRLSLKRHTEDQGEAEDGQGTAGAFGHGYFLSGGTFAPQGGIAGGAVLFPHVEVNTKSNQLTLLDTRYQRFGRCRYGVLRCLPMFDNLGRALYLIRDLRGLSQAEVARRARIGKSQLSKYESGKELPKMDSLKKVLRVLEVGPFEIFYTMHLIDLEALKLDHAEEAKLQALPPLVFPVRGVVADSTEEAFQRLFKEVISLYHSVFIERLKDLPRKH